jgi:MFS family permease
MNVSSLLSFIVATMLSGAFVTITGYCPPYMIASSVTAAIGAGFMTTFTVTTSHSKWIGLQVLVGLGVGLGIGVPTNAIQASLPAHDLKIAIAVLLCAQTLAAALFSSVAQNIFVNNLISGITANLPHVDPSIVLRSGILNLKFAEEIDEGVLPEIYNTALVDVFYLATALIAFSIFGALGYEWRSVKPRPYAGEAMAEDEEDFARRVHPWSALWTYTSMILSKLWTMSMGIWIFFTHDHIITIRDMSGNTWERRT